MRRGVCCAADPVAEAELLLDQRDLPAALAAFERAEGDGGNPDRCSAGLWMAHMLAGDFEAAWDVSDAIRRRGAPDPNRFWHGEDIRDKTVIVRCLHGLGDAVQFLRYAPQLRSLVSRLIVEAPPALLEVAPYFEGVEEVVSWGPHAPCKPRQWEVQIEVTELTYVFRTQLWQLPIEERYLHLSPEDLRSAAPRPRRNDSLRIGLVWSCGDWNRTRWVPLHLLERLMAMPGCEFWNLQGGYARAEWAALRDSENLHDANVCADSVLRLAALIAQLDLIITPDTLAAHLAGALGTPAWVMLQRTADWRWMHGRQDSPWYPSMRLFRQAVQGDWRLVVADLERALRGILVR